MNDITKKIAILVPSCDKYSDLWTPFFACFHRFWPNCPFDVHLLSNHLEFSDAKVRSLKVGDDASWSDNVAKAIAQLPHEYIFLFIDDLFLIESVDHNRVLSVVDWAVSAGVNYIRLNPSPGPDRPCNEMAGIVSPGAVYRASTVISVWKREVLLRLLRPAESAWEFEIKGSIRSDEFGGFYSTWVRCFPNINGVIKGKWRPDAVRKLSSLGIDIDLSKRSVMTPGEAGMFFLKRQRSRLLQMLPAECRRGVRASLIKSLA
jgi:hypothetical protein